jgi:hypothetical protein
MLDMPLAPVVEPSSVTSNLLWLVLAGPSGQTHDLLWAHPTDDGESDEKAFRQVEAHPTDDEESDK